MKKYDVEIYCSHPFYPEWKQVITSKSIDGLNIIRGKSIIAYPKNNFLRRAILELWFLLFCIRKIKNIRKNEIIFFVVPPSLFMFSSLFLPKKKLVAIVHDLQSIHIKNKSSFFRNLFAKIVDFIEGFFLKRFNKTFFLSSEMQNYAVNKLNINSVNCETVLPPITEFSFIDNNKLSNYFDNSKISVVYSGALGQKQNPYKLYELAVRLVSNNKFEFLFFSAGQDFENLKKQNTSKNIKFNKLVSKDNLGELLLKSDIQIIPQLTGTSSGSLPSKLPNILASGCTIFSIVDPNSDIQKMLAAQKNCFISNSWDINQNVQFIENVVSKNINKVDRNNDLKSFKRKISDLV